MQDSITQDSRKRCICVSQYWVRRAHYRLQASEFINATWHDGRCNRSANHNHARPSHTISTQPGEFLSHEKLVVHCFQMEQWQSCQLRLARYLSSVTIPSPLPNLSDTTVVHVMSPIQFTVVLPMSTSLYTPAKMPATSNGRLNDCRKIKASTKPP